MKVESTLKYRSVWMGLAMLFVVMYHSSYVLPISFFKNIGYGGVDICLFASGIGCYYSLCRNDDVFCFVKKRFLRIFPTYWCFLLFWFLYAFKAFGMTIPDVLGNIFGVQNFTGKGNAFNWYISAILLFYLLAPLFKKLADCCDDVLRQGIIVLLFVAFTISFVKSNTLIITVTRLPIFYLGMLYAKSAKKGSALSVSKIVIYIFAMVLGLVLLWIVFHHLKEYRWNYGLYWYPFILITPGFCVGVSHLMSLLDKSKFTSWIAKVLAFVGKYSFEIYLTHILIFDSVAYMVKNDILPNEKFVYVLSVASIPFACIILNYLVKFVTKTISRLFSKNKV